MDTACNFSCPRFFLPLWDKKIFYLGVVGTVKIFLEGVYELERAKFWQFVLAEISKSYGQSMFNFQLRIAIGIRQIVEHSVLCVPNILSVRNSNSTRG